jgi:hypothetical protein
MYWSLFLVATAALFAFFYLYVNLPGGEGVPDFLDKAGAFSFFKLGRIGIPSHRLAAAGIGLCCLYSALCLGYILFSFRTTVSTEIFFYAFWVLSLGFEVLRLLAFSLAAGAGSIDWQIAVTKALLFSRYDGYLSLLASGLFAAGFRSEKLGTGVAGIAAVALALAIAMPVNTGAFEPTLQLREGYSSIGAAVALVVAGITVANFLYAARAKEEPAYRLAAMGVAGFLAGQVLLVTQWNPLAAAGGFALIAAGSWLFVSRLHAYYLWQ